MPPLSQIPFVVKFLVFVHILSFASGLVSVLDWGNLTPEAQRALPFQVAVNGVLALGLFQLRDWARKLQIFFLVLLNFFTNPLGSLISTVGGGSFQFGILDDTEINLVLTLVAKSVNAGR